MKWVYVFKSSGAIILKFFSLRLKLIENIVGKRKLLGAKISPIRYHVLAETRR